MEKGFIAVLDFRYRCLRCHTADRIDRDDRQTRCFTARRVIFVITVSLVLARKPFNSLNLLTDSSDFAYGESRNFV